MSRHATEGRERHDDVPAPTIRQRVALLTEHDRWDLLRYAMSIAWAVWFVIFTPSSLIPFLPGAVTYLLMGLVVVGGLAGIVGRVLNEHLTIEFPGVAIALGGFLFYLLANLVLAIAVTTDRAALCWIIAIAASFLVERFLFLGTKWVAAVRGRS